MKFENFEIESEVTSMEVCEKISKYIDEHKISQIELCEKTNISPSKLNLSLNKKRKMTFEEYQTICWALGVGVDKFMEPRPPKAS